MPLKTKPSHDHPNDGPSKQQEYEPKPPKKQFFEGPIPSKEKVLEEGQHVLHVKQRVRESGFHGVDSELPGQCDAKPPEHDFIRCN